MSWDQYSETPASNYLAGYFLTGMAPSNVKVAGSDIMADLASRFNAMHTATGSANAQVVAQTRQWASLTNGLELIFLPVAANTGATTLAVDGLAAKNIFYNGAALTGGELSTTIPAWVKYDGTQFNLLHAATTPTAQNIQANKYIYAADTGAVNALVITPSPAITAYADGQSFLVKVANTTTNSTPTINVNALGAKNLYYPDGTTQILAGALILNNIYRMTYDSSINGFIVESPSSITGSFTLTVTGMSAGLTGTVNYRITPDGRFVYIYIISQITGTSNSSSMTGTGVPNILLTTNSGTLQIILEDSGGSVSGIVGSLNSSTWTFGKSVASFGGFTSTGTKGLNSPLGGGVWPSYPLF